MKKIFFLTCLMLSAVIVFAQETKKVAILEVVDREGQLSYSHKLLLRSSLAKAVSNTAGYEAYDRTDIDAIMSEQDFQRTGMVNGDQIKRLGEMIGVAYILVSEGAMMGDDHIFLTAKLLNVETAKLEMTDNQMVGMSPLELQKGCEALANTLFGNAENKSNIINPQKSKSYQKSEAQIRKVEDNKIDQTPVAAQPEKQYDESIAKISNKLYSYKGNTMNKKAYEAYLQYSCPQAYKQYHLGKQLNNGGWSCLAIGLSFVAGGSFLFSHSSTSSYSSYNSDGSYSYSSSSTNTKGVGTAILAIGVTAAITSVPLLTIGHIKQEKSVDIYNSHCISSPITFNLTSGQNGLGIAMNF